MASRWSVPLAATTPDFCSTVQFLSMMDQVLAQLRVLDYWRRLVNARLDLAVAAVADIDGLETVVAGLGAADALTRP